MVARMHYDGLGRRITKAVGNSADWDATFHYYYDGQRLIEQRDGSDFVLKQYVWGLGYIDELVQIALNTTPGEERNPPGSSTPDNLVDYYLYALQDANYNVLGVVNHAGRLVERYEYTPYGQRTVYSHGILPGDINDDGVVDLDDVLDCHHHATYGWGEGPATREHGDVNGDEVVDSHDLDIIVADYLNPSNAYPPDDPLVTYPRLESFRWAGRVVSLCDIGHQGLMHDREFGLIHNRARYLHPRLARFTTPDPFNQNEPGGGYQDGMSLFAYVGSRSISSLDPWGLYMIACCLPPSPDYARQLASDATYNTYTGNRIRMLHIRARAYLNVTGGREVGYRRSAEYLGHFLRNTGIPKVLNIDQLLAEDGGSKSYLHSEINMAKRFVERNIDAILASFWQRAVSREWRDAQATGDWGFALGGYRIAGVIDDAECVGKRYSMTFTYQATDFYGWDYGSRARGGLVRDGEMALLHRHGLAREYFVHGGRTFKVKWNKGERMPWVDVSLGRRKR